MSDYRLCAQCREAIFPDEETYVVKGGVCYCDLDCLAEFYVDNEDLSLIGSLEEYAEGYERRGLGVDDD